MADPAREVSSKALIPLACKELLVRRSADGDTAAFNELVIFYRAHVYRIAVEIVGPEAAEGVAQEAFLRAWRHLPSLRRPSAFRAWLERVTRSAAMDYLRARESTDGHGHLPADAQMETQSLATVTTKSWFYAARRALYRRLGFDST